MAKTSIAFLSGFDPVCPVPAVVKAADLSHRFAAIQHSYVEGSPDMVFDEALERALLRFAAALGAVEIKHRLVLVRSGGELIACIATEEWAAIGGPEPYHDSYTHSIFTKADLSSAVMHFLADCEEASGWSLAAEIMTPPPRPNLLQRLLQW